MTENVEQPIPFAHMDADEKRILDGLMDDVFKSFNVISDRVKQIKKQRPGGRNYLLLAHTIKKYTFSIYYNGERYKNSHGVYYHISHCEKDAAFCFIANVRFGKSPLPKTEISCFPRQMRFSQILGVFVEMVNNYEKYIN